MRWAERRGFGVTADRRAMETAAFWQKLRSPALHDANRYAALRRSLVISRHAHRLEAFYARDFRRCSFILGKILVDHPADGPSLVLMSRAVDAMLTDGESFKKAWVLPGK